MEGFLHNLKLKVHIKPLDNKDRVALILCLLIFVYGLFVALILRYPTNALYLQETMIISELLKQGKWIGNYGVGTHGFLFKIPPAIFFFLTGPSVLVAILFNVFLASISCWIFYKIQKDYLKFGWWSILGCFFLVTSQVFLFVVPTYLREIPLLFSLLIFFYLFFKEVKHYWALGLALTLVLDAKEYAFFNVAVTFIVWSFIGLARQKSGPFFQAALHRAYINLQVFLPSLAFIILMFFTSIIPLNIFTAFILGVTQKNNFVQYATKFVTKENTIIAKSNVLTESITKTVATKVNKITKDDSSNTATGEPLSKVSNYINQKVRFFTTIGGNYIRTLLNPISFGLSSIPFFICVPAILFSFKYLKNDKLLFLSIYQNIFLVTYLSQYNLSRYLFPVYLTLVIFFILYLKDDTSRKLVLLITLLTLILTSLQMREEVKFANVKIIFQSLLLTALFMYKLVYNPHTRVFLLLLFSFLILALSLGMRTAEIIAGRKNGLTQLSRVTLAKFYSKDTYINPESQWKLKAWVPKKHMLTILETDQNKVTKIHPPNQENQIDVLDELNDHFMY